MQSVRLTLNNVMLQKSTQEGDDGRESMYMVLHLSTRQTQVTHTHILPSVHILAERRHGAPCCMKVLGKIYTLLKVLRHLFSEKVVMKLCNLFNSYFVFE